MNDALAAALKRGQQALDDDRLAAAIDAFTAARQLAPSDPSIGLLLANAQRLAGDIVDARQTLVAASRQPAPADPAFSYQLGASLLELGAPREAAGCFTRVVRARPTDPAPLAALAGARRANGDLDAAWSSIEQALALDPNLPASRLTAAQIRHDMGDLAGAQHWLDRADAVRSQHVPTTLQRAYTSLLQGSSREGWRLFESRQVPTPRTSARAWHGEPLTGASVLVAAEQGIGDQFQFVRFVSALIARGAARVIVECHADVVPLLRANGLDAVPRGTDIETEWHVPLLSLPHRLDLDTDVMGEMVPYLRAPADSSRQARHADALRRLGVVWAGNPSFSGRITRDFAPALLPDLAAIPGVEWISLQFGEAALQAPESFKKIELPRNWLDTAALLSQLDGLVTTDTGIAHLAGAMGIPGWVLLQAVPDWRWGMGPGGTPWYPTLRLLRQHTPGDWPSVVDALRIALASHTAR